MSRQTGGGRGNNGGGVARGAGFAAAKGAGLILFAVVLGVVLLQIVDDGSEGPADSADGGAGATTTTVTPADDGDSDDTTPDDTQPEKSPAELRVIVLNGGAPAGSAREMSSALQQAGYTNQAQATDWVGQEQTGNSVLCTAGLEREAATLATAVGSGTTTAAFPDPVPPGAEEVDCIVAVGSNG